MRYTVEEIRKSLGCVHEARSLPHAKALCFLLACLSVLSSDFRADRRHRHTRCSKCLIAQESMCIGRTYTKIHELKFPPCAGLLVGSHGRLALPEGHGGSCDMICTPSSPGVRRFDLTSMAVPSWSRDSFRSLDDRSSHMSLACLDFDVSAVQTPVCMHAAGRSSRFLQQPLSWSQEPPARQSISFIPCSLTIHNVKRSNGSV